MHKILLTNYKKYENCIIADSKNIRIFAFYGV